MYCEYVRASEVHFLSVIFTLTFSCFSILPAQFPMERPRVQVRKRESISGKLLRNASSIAIAECPNATIARR
jgi:hypothetical protein